jgi:hypothetical protein
MRMSLGRRTRIVVPGGTVLYMVIERFRGGDPVPVYRRFRDRGRLAPEGLRYVASWVTADFQRCYQVMECDERVLLEAWIAQWRDLVEFEVIPVRTSADAVALLASQL